MLFVVGVGIQRFAINPVMDAPVHNQLMLTLGITIIIENLALVLFTGTPRSIELAYARNEFDLGLFTLDFPIKVFGAVITLPKLIAFVVALVLAGVLYMLIHRTQLGAAIRASAQEPEGAEMVGIDVRRIYTITFGIGAACVGAVGIADDVQQRGATEPDVCPPYGFAVGEAHRTGTSQQAAHDQRGAKPLFQVQPQ